MEKKSNNYDFKYYENYIEIQSIELACFILTVCNVVLLTEDWFLDPSLFKLLHTAEMLMPSVNLGLNQANASTTTTASSTSATDELYCEHHAHLGKLVNLFFFNCAKNHLYLEKSKFTC